MANSEMTKTYVLVLPRVFYITFTQNEYARIFAKIVNDRQPFKFQFYI